MPRRPVAVVGWIAGVSIGAALLIMIGAALIRPTWMNPPIPMPRIGPP